MTLDFDVIAAAVMANVDAGVPSLRRVYDHEPAEPLAYGLLPFATVFLAGVSRPGLLEAKGTMGPRYMTEATWLARVYFKLQDAEKAQADFRAAATTLLAAWDQYPFLSAPPGNVAAVDDSTVSAIEPFVERAQGKPVLILQATVQTLTIAP